ncbi:hypothetical protein, partial [Pseudomonas aeruginosa]|uniref:hypothetical protein n=1 Tax=Pseudomonas aeruginosa TaxID=287 RepID=UPI001F1A902D
AISLGLLEPDGLGYLARSPKALLAGAQMAKAGFPLVEVLDIIERARPHTQAVADDGLEQLLDVGERVAAPEQVIDELE